MLLYHNPKRTMTVTKFLEDLEVFLSHCPQGLPSFLLGDFNIDLSLNTTSAKHLQNLIKYYGFRPCVSEPTHRQGGHLDNIFTNILFTPVLDVIPKYLCFSHLLFPGLNFTNETFQVRLKCVNISKCTRPNCYRGKQYET